MEFKYVSLVKEFSLHRTQRRVELHLPGENDSTKAVLRRQRKEEFPTGTGLGWAVTEVSSKRTVNRLTESCLQSTANGCVPRFKRLKEKGDPIVLEQLGYIANDDGTLKPGRELDSWLLPESVQQELNSVRHHLREKTQLLIDTIRWRQALDGPHQPLAHMRLFWRQDREDWREVPGRLHTTVSVHRGLGHSAKWKSSVQKLLSSGSTPPAAHELLREAQELANTSPRSSLVIGIAAAEIAVRQCIANLIPKAEWLAFEYQGVTVDAALKNFIPSISQVQSVAVVEELDSIRRVVNKAIRKRNRLVHRTALTITPDEVKKYLDSFGTLVRLLDGISSYPWALDYLHLPEAESPPENPRVKIARSPK